MSYKKIFQLNRQIAFDRGNFQLMDYVKNLVLIFFLNKIHSESQINKQLKYYTRSFFILRKIIENNTFSSCNKNKEVLRAIENVLQIIEKLKKNNNNRKNLPMTVKIHIIDFDDHTGRKSNLSRQTSICWIVQRERGISVASLLSIFLSILSKIEPILALSLVNSRGYPSGSHSLHFFSISPLYSSLHFCILSRISSPPLCTLKR